MPPNAHLYFLVFCTGASVFYIIAAWAWCRRGNLSRGVSIGIVLSTWAGVMAVCTSITFMALSRSAISAHRETTMLEIAGHQLRTSLLASPRNASPLRLNHSGAKAYSQNGEDGIIAEIFRRIGVTNRFFVEFGSSDGSENNTVLLLRQGWSGQWVEGDHETAERARVAFAPEIEVGRLVVTEAFITAEHTEQLLKEGGAPEELDLFSLDIDRNDYYVWEAVRSYRPRVAVIEYNAIFPPGVDWVIDYDAAKWWDGTSKYGASLSALERLGREKGYSLVGCDLSGVNSFFVRSDLVAELFESPFTAEHHYEPPRFALKFTWGGHPRKP
jgi:hypothetical protein